MSEHEQFFVVLGSGQRFGPAAMDVVMQWAREGRVPRDAVLQSTDPAAPPRSVLAEPRLSSIIGAPPTVAGPVIPQEDGAVTTLIPYKNGFALTAYYLGVLALIPFLGLLPALFAIGFGIAGIRVYYREPKRKGIAHAWTGILLGVFSFVATALILFVVIPRMR